MKSINTKTTFIVILTLLTAGFAFPQHHNDDSWDDRKMPVISDNTEKMLDRIKEKLDELDADYLTQLRPREYNKSVRELHKIYRMIEAIKNQQDVEVYPVVLPMNEPDYRSLVNSINNEAFEDNKIAVLQSSVKYNYFTVDQIIGLMDLSSFSSWKLKALELTYPFVVDKNNSFKIINSLTFSGDKEKAQEILNRN
ncbi:MAG TPA: DUF4476 domain-containing protein [Ignavibacteriaceae bacterium]|nr:DUF4476 domain-containing protein [Ignavibacteriaceae bacterium]